MAFWGDVSVHRAVFWRGGWSCDGQRARKQWHSGGCCGVSGSVVGEEAVAGDTVEAEGREGVAMDHAGVVVCSVYGQRSGAMGSVVRGEAAVQLTAGQDAAVYLYFICTWARARSIGGRRWITLRWS